jgi:hypothetical protein
MLPSVAVGVVTALCVNEEMAASAVVMVLAVEVDAATATRCCQVCGKTGHTTLRCYKHFDANYNGDDKHANVATSSYNIDIDWHTNTGATDHITSEIDKLTVREMYGGIDQVHTVSGSGMPISQVGQSAIHTHERDLILKDILHAPSTSKNLVSVYKFTYDNNAFFEFHPWYFLLKDRDMKNLLLQGRCRSGLYPFPTTAWSSTHLRNKNALITIKPTLA